MSTPVRLAAFLLGLVLVGGASYALGDAVGPVGPERSAPTHEQGGHP